MNRDEQIAALAQEFRQIMRDRPEGLAERAFWDNLARDCAGIARKHIDAASRVEATDEMAAAALASWSRGASTDIRGLRLYKIWLAEMRDALDAALAVRGES